MWCYFSQECTPHYLSNISAALAERQTQKGWLKYCLCYMCLGAYDKWIHLNCFRCFGSRDNQVAEELSDCDGVQKGRYLSAVSTVIYLCNKSVKSSCIIFNMFSYFSYYDIFHGGWSFLIFLFYRLLIFKVLFIIIIYKKIEMQKMEKLTKVLIKKRVIVYVMCLEQFVFY